MDVEQKIKGLEERLQKLEERVSKLEGKPEGAKKPMAISEFFQQKKPKSEPNQTLAIAYYLQEYKGLSSFNLNDLKKAFRSVGAKTPGNIHDTIYKNLGKGYMAVADKEKENLTAWHVTESGCKYVENGFKKKKEE